MKRIYIAGKLNDMACDYLSNCHHMMQAAEECRQKGFSVYVPCVDLLMGLMFGYYKYNDYFWNSQPWLMAADAVLVVQRGAGTSAGTQKEIELAHKMRIPVFTDLDDLVRWRNENL